MGASGLEVTDGKSARVPATACSDPPKPCADGRRMAATAPPFTIGQLRKAVPAHCFERSVVISTAYLLVDLLAVAGLFTACLHIDGLPWWASLILWPLYWVCQVSHLNYYWFLITNNVIWLRRTWWTMAKAP